MYDLPSKRFRRASSAMPSTLIYNDVPQPLRVQAWMLAEYCPEFHLVCVGTEHILCHEYGRFSLAGQRRGWSKKEDVQDIVKGFFLTTEHFGEALDVIVLIYGAFYRGAAGHLTERQRLEHAIKELNSRFLEHNIGYQLVEDKLVRIDSEFAHMEMVEPAMKVLREPWLDGANVEFLRALDHYRHGGDEYGDCLSECGKAFESTMKAICAKHDWAYDERDTTKQLIATCLQNGLIRPYLQEHFTGLRISLESGVPTVRNREDAHGQGTIVREVPEYLAAYLLHLTASNILLLVEAERELP